MRIRPEDLESQGYVLLDKLDHKELVPFVRTYLKKNTTISAVYTWTNVLIAACTLVWFWKSHSTFDVRIPDAIGYFSYGLAIAFTLIPLHEYIHVLAYRSQGAVKTSYDVYLRKFYFMALADMFVANRKEFRIIALAPMVVISTILILLLTITSPLWSFTILGILLTHTAFSSGDFGLLSYFEFHKDKDIVTYDDKTHRLSYFYGKERI